MILIVYLLEKEIKDRGGGGMLCSQENLETEA